MDPVDVEPKLERVFVELDAVRGGYYVPMGHGCDIVSLSHMQDIEHDPFTQAVSVVDALPVVGPSCRLQGLKTAVRRKRS